MQQPLTELGLLLCPALLCVLQRNVHNPLLSIVKIKRTKIMENKQGALTMESLYKTETAYKLPILAQRLWSCRASSFYDTTTELLNY